MISLRGPCMIKFLLTVISTRAETLASLVHWYVPKHLEQYVVYSRHSVHICWTNEWIDTIPTDCSEPWYLVSAVLLLIKYLISSRLNGCSVCYILFLNGNPGEGIYVRSHTYLAVFSRVIFLEDTFPPFLWADVLRKKSLEEGVFTFVALGEECLFLPI